MRITTGEQLRSLYAQPTERALRKQLPALDRHCKAFIALSPFVMLATSDAAGRVDATPRGGAPGFVVVQDEHTLLLGDAPGNNRLDALQNLLENPQAGLLFLIPGFFSDILAILALLPPVQGWVRSRFRVATFSTGGTANSQPFGARRFDTVIDGEAVEIAAEVEGPPSSGKSKG